MLSHVNIEVTGRCNQRCIYCFNESGPNNRQSLKVEQSWDIVITKLKALGVTSVHLTGGEPFVYSGLKSLIMLAVNEGLSVSILSNGFRARDLIKCDPLLYSKISVAQISLDSLDQNVVNQRRGSKRAFSDAMSAIDIFDSLKVPVEISAVIDKETINGLLSLAQFCKNRGFKLIPRPIQYIGRCKMIFQGDDLNVQIYRLEKSLPNVFTKDIFHYLPEDRLVGFDQGAITIEYTGKISPPAIIKGKKFHLSQELLNVA